MAGSGTCVRLNPRLWRIWVLVAERAPRDSMAREADTLSGEKKTFWSGVFKTSLRYRRKAKLVLLEDSREAAVLLEEDGQRDPLLGVPGGGTQRITAQMLTTRKTP